MKMRTRPDLHSLANPAVVSALVSLTLTILLYGDALSLPLFSDDLIQIPWLESITWRELWTSPSPYRYYRPLWYTLWRLWGMLFGGLYPLGLHLLNLIAHFVASCLAGLLAATWESWGANHHRLSHHRLVCRFPLLTPGGGLAWRALQPTGKRDGCRCSGRL